MSDAELAAAIERVLAGPEGKRIARLLLDTAYPQPTEMRSAEQVVDEVAVVFGVSPVKQRGPERTAATCAARRASMYIMYTHYGFGTTSLGHYFGRDPSTPRAAVSKARGDMVTDPNFREKVHRVLARLEPRCAA